MSPIPVLVGGSRYTHKGDGIVSPLSLCATSAASALSDSGLSIQEVDTVGVVGTILDAGLSPAFERIYPNMPAALMERLGGRATDKKSLVTTHVGGNSPQALVNHFAEEVVEGRAGVVLLTGVEAIASLLRALKGGDTEAVDRWREEGEKTKDIPQTFFGTDKAGFLEAEQRAGLSLPVAMYPVLETARRAQRGSSPSSHFSLMGSLFDHLNEVAVSSEERRHSWKQARRTAEALVTPSERNRWISWPYTKSLCATIEVDQAASVILTTEDRALSLGVPADRLVYVHGCGDCCDHWAVTEREEPWVSTGMRFAFDACMRQAGLDIQKGGAKLLTGMDLYSCFPVAVEMGAEALGLSEEALLSLPRKGVPFSLTGGLPFHGGPGNNYTMHAIVAAVERCRSSRQAGKDEVLFVNGNGHYTTKHSAGVYGTKRPVSSSGPWKREDPAETQRRHDRAVRKAEPLDPDAPEEMALFSGSKKGGVSGIGAKVTGVSVSYASGGKKAPGILKEEKAKGGRPVKASVIGVLTGAGGLHSPLRTFAAVVEPEENLVPAKAFSSGVMRGLVSVDEGASAAARRLSLLQSIVDRAGPPANEEFVGTSGVLRLGVNPKGSLLFFFSPHTHAARI
uniref:Thiolase-like protein type 1 additional C-terminal domain-containing protein n=1 Tax=Chromera velia CCMP2878 TaxID=1169474 RepID=A0A0G4HDK7_9ALVE|eukprot:Cvel_26508.t1-p1 / transcript=Cvel_26508.t1 / gene=Cvel_26508 / organism=Chromera_velia_CCMP2878 / gene_product=hypothetical protein / transcript_product=hypothetical protein / location=Cvel_scaffold3163:3997-7316(+) / protein_length=622 / sequence_SO=supercontig / SO=protein_coding / is_pseudo=false